MQESTKQNNLLGPPIRSFGDLAKELQSYIANNPQIFGGVDIYNISFQNPQARAGVLAGVLIGLVDDKQRSAVRKFVVVVPAGSDLKESEAQAWSEMVATFHLLCQREMEPRERDLLRARFQTVVAKDRRSHSVLDIISAQSERTAVIVTESASYRDDSVKPYISPGASTPLLSEDIWVPQIHALAVEAVNLAHARQLYVALDADQLSPSRKVLSDLLGSIKNCGVMGMNKEDDPDQILSAKADQWDTWIREGCFGRVLRDIETLPTILNGSKSYLRCQILHKAKCFPETLQAVREYIALGQNLDGSVRVKLARIAQDANASRLAAEILSPVIDQLNSQEDLESALATSHDTGSTELEEKVAVRLDAMFPGSPGIRQRHRRDLLAKRDFAAVAAMYAEEGDQDSVEFYQRLASFLSVSGVPNYQALIAQAEGNIPQADAYQMACVSDALARRLLVHALDLALPIPTTPVQAETGERLLLQILKALLLEGQRIGTLPVPLERIQDAVLSLIKRLAANPSNQATRIGLANLIQPSVAGVTGLALMATIVLDLGSRPIGAVKSRFRRTSDMSWLLAHKSFVEAAFGWFESEGPVVPGKTALPSSLLTEPANDVVSAIADYLEQAPIESDDDTKADMRYLTLASSVTPYSSDPDFDLVLLRLAAGRFAMSGHAQLARDLVEQALLNSTATPRRCRLGWFVMADVYHRCHTRLEALVAMACTLAADDEGEEVQLYQESITIARILRDCHLNNQALAAITLARQLLHVIGLSEAYSHRLDTFELQIRHLGVRRNPDKAELEALIADAVRNADAVLRKGDETGPVAAVLGQLIYQGKDTGLTIPAEAEKMFRELCNRSRGNPTSTIAMVSAAAPSADELLALLKASDSARYSEDVGHDMHDVAIAASRALFSDPYIADPIHTSFALELLADRGIAVPGWDETAKPPRAPERVDEPAEIACSLSKEGLNVVQVGFDAAGRLIHVAAVGGALETPVRDCSNVNAGERFAHWAKEYPFQYGINETTTNLFYTTTAALCLPSLPKEGPVVVVADVSFQPFPPNLLYVNDEFAGRVRPMAAAPSLLWLKSALARGTAGDGRLCAWISKDIVKTAESQTLSMIAERLTPTFESYGFTVDNSPKLPAAFANASMAVIAAHGGVHPDGRYFQVVSDEGKLRVTARDLANALRNIDVVILFVCSGGRVDKHPEAITTLGLARQILDRGCAAIIASPWPLDSRVPSHWLPEFLHHWYQGKPLIEANFAANNVVDRAFAQDPARGLAMTILGNPALCRPKRPCQD